MWRRDDADPDHLAFTDRDLRSARWVTIAGTILFLFVVCQWRPWTLFDRAGFSADFYDTQAHAFLRLHLDVPASIPGPEGFLIDGRTYLYYGPFLALVRLPFAVFGHWADGRLVRLSLTIGYAALCSATYHLATEASRCWSAVRPRQSRLPATLVVAAMAVSPALYLSGWVSVYHETEMWAAVLCVAAAAKVLALWRAPSRRHLLWAAGFAVAALLTRATVGIGAFVALAGVGLLLWRRARPLALGAVGAAFAGALVHVGLNMAKFGTPFDLPADRQLLTLQSPVRAAWFAGNHGSFFSPRFLPTTVVQYLRPDTIRFERLVPFVRFGPLAHEYGSYPLETNTPSSSLTASATLLVVLAVAGVVVLFRRRLWGPLVALVGLVVAAIPSFLIGFTANRYLVDMLPALALPAAFAAVAFVPPTRAWLRRLAIGGVVAGVLWGTWVNIALATWTQQLKSPGFTAWRYQIDDAVFGGTPPSVVRIAGGMAVPRDGIVGIDGDCAGLYIAEQGVWVALERAADRELRGTFVPGSDVTVLGGDTGAIVLATDESAGTAQISWVPSGAEPLDGPALAWDGSPPEIDVVADPLTGSFYVTVDEKVALFAGDPPDLGAMAPGAGFTIEVTSTPLCNALAARL
ncbi:MAG: hypothetical protein QM733_15970 [Ilumatobacteraceae bacterium]